MNALSRDKAARTVTAKQMERLSRWAGRKPVIALMGEFSSGKSTLLNMLVGRSILPTQVTATRLPPVWLRYGDESPFWVDHNGDRHDVDVNDLASVPLKEARFIRIYAISEQLKKCDLIDTPGISDPNIPTDSWINTIGYANSVLWCTHAGQAWRESERSQWESLPERLRESSLLLVTRADKIVSREDLEKINRRLLRETSGLFGAHRFISLTLAIRARQDDDHNNLWVRSGGEAFMKSLEHVLTAIAQKRAALLQRYQSRDNVSVLRPTRIRPNTGELEKTRLAPEAAEDLRSSVVTEPEGAGEIPAADTAVIDETTTGPTVDQDSAGTGPEENTDQNTAPEVLEEAQEEDVISKPLSLREAMAVPRAAAEEAVDVMLPEEAVTDRVPEVEDTAAEVDISPEEADDLIAETEDDTVVEEDSVVTEAADVQEQPVEEVDLPSEPIDEDLIEGGTEDIVAEDAEDEIPDEVPEAVEEVALEVPYVEGLVARLARAAGESADDQPEPAVQPEEETQEDSQKAESELKVPRYMLLQSDRQNDDAAPTPDGLDEDADVEIDTRMFLDRLNSMDDLQSDDIIQEADEEVQEKEAEAEDILSVVSKIAAVTTADAEAEVSEEIAVEEVAIEGELSQSPSDIWKNILATSEIETVPQMAAAISELLEQLDQKESGSEDI